MGSGIKTANVVKYYGYIKMIRSMQGWIPGIRDD